MVELAKICYNPVAICNDLAKYETETIMCRFIYFILQGISFLQASEYETNHTSAKACFWGIHVRANRLIKFTSKIYIFCEKGDFRTMMFMTPSMKYFLDTMDNL